MKVAVRSSLSLFFLAALVFGILWSWHKRVYFEPRFLATLLHEFGFWSPIIYLFIYALATVALIPGALLTVAGGVIFGPVWGAVLSLMGATLGATLAFLIGRYTLRDWLENWLRNRKLLTEIVEEIERQSWKFVAFVRLVPIIPFNLINYALGVTRIGLIPYVTTSFFCMAPGAIAYSLAGYGGREVLKGDLRAFRFVGAGVGLMILLSLISQAARRRGDRPFIEPKTQFGLLPKKRGCVVIDSRTSE